ncbi:MAG: single-stranded DNA-binding protein [Anaerolineae bacterium]
MVRGLNKVLIIGQLGRDPEMRFTGSGCPVTTFNVKTTRGWTNDHGEREEESEWFHVVAWGGLAEVCKQHLQEDALVYVEGRLQTRSWDDAEGQRHYRTELVAQEVIFLDHQNGQQETDIG